jgi:hypothetical protein
MEETNYDRHFSQSAASSQVPSNEVITPVLANTEKSNSQKSTDSTIKTPSDPATVETGQIVYPRKTYFQKLSVIDKKRPNRVWDVMVAPFKFFRFPVIVWAGFMYGTNGLVWPGILNATASPVYTGTYHFNSNDVGFAYFGAVVGMVFGSVPYPLSFLSNTKKIDPCG